MLGAVLLSFLSRRDWKWLREMLGGGAGVFQRGDTRVHGFGGRREGSVEERRTHEMWYNHVCRKPRYLDVTHN